MLHSKCVRRVAIAAAASFAAVGVGLAQDQEGADIPFAFTSDGYYVRIGYEYSNIQTGHVLGAGTVVGNGQEMFNGTFDDYIDRNGFSAEFGHVGPCEFDCVPDFVNGWFGKVQHARGESSFNSGYQVGVGGITGVGFTYLEPITSEPGNPTGVIGGAGFGVQTSGQLSNSWTLALGGVNLSVYEDQNTRFQVGTGLYYENLDTDSTAQAYLDFNGVRDTRFGQTYTLNTKDDYYGVRISPTFEFRPGGSNFEFSVGAHLDLSYHEGRGEYLQSNTRFGTQFDQRRSYNDSDFSVGGGFDVGVGYRFNPKTMIKANYTFSRLADATVFTAPANPNQQANAGFRSDSLDRHFGMISLQRSF